MTTTTQTAFPAALKQARLQRKLSQKKLSELADVSHSFLSRLESGTRNPARATVIALAAALGCDDLETDELLGAADFAPESDELRSALMATTQRARLRRLKRDAWAEALRD